MSLWKSVEKSDSAFSGTSMSVRCYESHPVLKMGKGKLYGGSASSPMAKDADVYVSLQSGSTSGKISDPWEEKNKVVEIQYPIMDTQIPTNTPRFKKMVTWLCTQLHDGKNVHVGCVGGHGRTGIVLSAIVAEMTGEKDAIQWVRKHYCKKVVESKMQVQFLVKHYGVSEVEPSKVWEENYKGMGKWMSQGKAASDSDDYYAKVPKARHIPAGVTSRTKSYTPITSARSLWKPKKKKD